MGALKYFFSRNGICVPSISYSWPSPSIYCFGGVKLGPCAKDLLLKLERFVNRQVRKILRINLWHVKKYHIKVDDWRKRFNGILSVQTMIDIRRMDYLGKIVRGPVTRPPRQILIAYCQQPRNPGRPIFSNRESLHASLIRLMEPIAGIHIDRVGSLKEWYRDALCNIFWYKCIALLRDPSQPIPERPNPTASYNPRRSTRNRFPLCSSAGRAERY